MTTPEVQAAVERVTKAVAARDAAVLHDLRRNRTSPTPEKLAAERGFATVPSQRLDDLLAILSALATAEGERDAMREALKEAESVFALVERPAFIDPQHGEAVRQLGERIGYGALMSSASASWRVKLSDRPGGEFVAGPCHGTVVATLKTIRAALTPTTKEADHG